MVNESVAPRASRRHPPLCFWIAALVMAMLLAFALLSVDATGTTAGDGEVLGAVGGYSRVGTVDVAAPRVPPAREAVTGLLNWVAQQLGLALRGNGANGASGRAFIRDSSGL